MGQMFYGVSDLEVKSVTVNFNINTNCPCNRSAIYIIGRICLIHFTCYNILDLLLIFQRSKTDINISLEVENEVDPQ